MSESVVYIWCGVDGKDFLGDDCTLYYHRPKKRCCQAAALQFVEQVGHVVYAGVFLAR